jgi:hypothetical protein
MSLGVIETNYEDQKQCICEDLSQFLIEARFSAKESLLTFEILCVILCPFCVLLRLFLKRKVYEMLENFRSCKPKEGYFGPFFMLTTFNYHLMVKERLPLNTYWLGKCLMFMKMNILNITGTVLIQTFLVWMEFIMLKSQRTIDIYLQDQRCDCPFIDKGILQIIVAKVIFSTIASAFVILANVRNVQDGMRNNVNLLIQLFESLEPTYRKSLIESYMSNLLHVNTPSNLETVTISSPYSQVQQPLSSLEDEVIQGNYASDLNMAHFNLDNGLFLARVFTF